MGICLSAIEDASRPQQSQPPSSNELVPVERPPFFEAHPTVQSSTHKTRLSQVDPKTIPNVIFKGQIIDVYVYEVYDGDTLHFLIDLGDERLAKLALRMIGIDTPEIHAGKDRLPQEKLAGMMARDYLKTLVRGYTKIRISDWDKFGGRCLGEVILPNGQSTANEMMIQKGYARPYHGEKKQGWALEDLTRPPFNLPRELDQDGLRDLDPEKDEL